LRRKRWETLTHPLPRGKDDPKDWKGTEGNPAVPPPKNYTPSPPIPMPHIVSQGPLHDEDISSVDTTVVPPTTQIQGPITRARAKQLNYQVLSFLGTITHTHENMMPKSDVFVTLRNDGPSMDERDKHWSMIGNEDGSKHVRTKEEATSGDFRTLKPR
jgi:hypothetical protein